MLLARYLRAGAQLSVAAGVLACAGQVVSDDEPEPAEVLLSFCSWARQCVDEFDREYGSEERCVQVELYRHAEPNACSRANAAFKECLVQLSCEEYRSARPRIDALRTGEDAGSLDGVPCLLDLAFYYDGCADWSCANGEVVTRDKVCNLAPDCQDGSDETGCP